MKKITVKQALKMPQDDTTQYEVKAGKGLWFVMTPSQVTAHVNKIKTDIIPILERIVE